MSAMPFLRTLYDAFSDKARGLQPVVPLLTRVVFGHAFLVTGLGKLRHLDRTTAFFGQIGIPLPGFHAGLVGVIELVGGAMLLLGLGTRVAALLLSGTMAVALATADKAALLAGLNLGGSPALTQVTAFVFLLFLLWLLAYGPGPLSLDRSLARGMGASGKQVSDDRRS